MKIRSDKQRIRDVLTQTIVSLCHTGLNFNKQMTVEGLLGITLDNNDVFLVNIKEVLQPAFGSTEDSPGSPASEKSGRDRDQRRSVQRGSKRKVVCVDEDEDSRGSDLMLMEEQSPASTHPQEDMRVPPATYHHDSPHSSRTTFAHQPDFTSYSASSRSIGPNHQSKSDTRDSFSISDSHDDTVVKEESGLLSSCQISSISRPPSSAESGRSEQTDIAEHSHHGSHSVLPSGSEVTSADDDLKIKAEPDYLDTDYGALQPMEDTGGLPDFSSITADESGLTAAEVGFDPSLLAHAQAGPSHMSMPGPMPSTSDASGTQCRMFASPVKNMNTVEYSAAAKSTARRNKWAFNTFNKWRILKGSSPLAENSLCMQINKPIVQMTNKELDQWMGKFILEVRNESGKEYSPKELRSLLRGIQGHLCLYSREVCFMDTKEFQLTRKSLHDESIRLAHLTAVNIQNHKNKFFAKLEEEKLWSIKILGDFDPVTLLQTILFLNIKHFGIDSAADNRNLRFKPAQLTLYEDSEVPGQESYLHYRDDQGRQAVHYARPDNKQRCHIRLYKMYMALSPQDGRDDSFYLQPLQNAQEDQWYSRYAYEINALSGFIKYMSDNAAL